MIIAKNLNKNFKTYKKTPGFKGSLQDLFKRQYQNKVAVCDFDVEIQQGEIVGLLGPNGAGKTTLMKMFTGIVVPSNGELSVLGHTPEKREKEFRRKIALVMGQKSQLWWDIPAMDSFLLLKRYYEIEEGKFKQRVDELSQILGVTDHLKTQIRRLSLGERMKMELMASLLHSPEIIFLDEPTIGLDLVAQENIRHFIKNYQKENNTTMIITSHYMADVEALCQRLIVVFQGKKKFDGPIEQFSTMLEEEGKAKLLSLTFKDERGLLWLKTAPAEVKEQWRWIDQQCRQAEVKLAEEFIATFMSLLFQEDLVEALVLEKTPIEKVMKSMMSGEI